MPGRLPPVRDACASAPEAKAKATTANVAAASLVVRVGGMRGAECVEGKVEGINA